MPDVTITMTVDTVALKAAIDSNTAPNLGSIISHTVTGGIVTKDPDDPNNSQKDTIVIMTNKSINMRFASKDGDTISTQKVCTFINFGVKNGGGNNLIININQVNGPAGGGLEKQLNAQSGTLQGTLNYFITFTIMNRQFTFDPKIQVRIVTLP
jgi:hypothetical protein